MIVFKFISFYSIDLRINTSLDVLKNLYCSTNWYIVYGLNINLAIVLTVNQKTNISLNVLIKNVLINNLSLFFPSIKSSEETGRLRGYIFITNNKIDKELLNSIDELNQFNFWFHKKNYIHWFFFAQHCRYNKYNNH